MTVGIPDMLEGNQGVEPAPTPADHTPLPHTQEADTEPLTPPNRLIGVLLQFFRDAGRKAAEGIRDAIGHYIEGAEEGWSRYKPEPY